MSAAATESTPTHPLKGLRAGTHELPLALIRVDGETQIREGLSEEHIERLMEAYSSSVRSVQPLICYWDGESLWLADGYHRHAALVRRADPEGAAWVDVRKGSQRDALEYALAANSRHGLPRSRADKRRAVVRALQDQEWSALSDRKVAEMCAVSHTFVGGVRRELAAPAVAEVPAAPDPATPGGNVATPEPTQPEEASPGEVTERDPGSAPSSTSVEAPATPALDALVANLHGMLEHWTDQGLRHVGVQPAQVRLEKHLGHKLRDEQWDEILQAGVAAKLWQHDPARGVFWLIPWDAGINEHHVSAACDALIGILIRGDALRQHPMPLQQARESTAAALRGVELDDRLWRATLEALVEGRVCARDGAAVWMHRKAAEELRPKTAELDHDDPAVQGHLASLEDDEDPDTDEEEDELEEDIERSDDDPELGVEFVRLALQELEGGAAGSPWRLETVRARSVERAGLQSVSDASWQAALDEGVRRAWWRVSGNALRLLQPELTTPKARPPAMPPEQLAPAPTPLPDAERAPLDAYWTPDAHAQALTRWLDEGAGGEVQLWPRHGPYSILESAAGGGAWLRSCRDTWPGAELTAIDIDPDAPGLTIADYAYPEDFLVRGRQLAQGAAPDQRPYDLVIGNPPYGLDLVEWIDLSRELAPVVGYLLRVTFLGSLKRMPWWRARPPSDVVVVPRPIWEGPGARDSTDKVESVFVLWREGYTGPPRLHWLEVRERS